MTLAMWIATAAWLSLLLAYRFRRIRTLHVCFALGGMFCDISLVLYLQITRSAIQTATSFSLSVFEQTHILFSTLALICYFPTIALGAFLLANPTRRALAPLHRRVAVTALTLRTCGFIFMFSMWRS
jgi:hypothetical protein